MTTIKPKWFQRFKKEMPENPCENDEFFIAHRSQILKERFVMQMALVNIANIAEKAIADDENSAVDYHRMGLEKIIKLAMEAAE